MHLILTKVSNIRIKMKTSTRDKNNFPLFSCFHEQEAKGKYDEEKFKNKFLVCFCHPAVAREDRSGDLLICKLFPSEFSSGYDEKPRFTEISITIGTRKLSLWICYQDSRLKQLVRFANRKMFNFDSQALTTSFKVARRLERCVRLFRI